ncbi:MAG: putative toxin-antitoxin system toxin component, PIN family, partial [Candidatus Latescibacteria bacterium]|nr:putative toxin-antitoxin system toxin component, PIN family [Candidatus Latescibacterota bacterium]
VISRAILAEIDRVFHYPKIIKYHRWSEERIQLFLEDLVHVAILTPGKLQLTVITEDPPDNRYLECAVEGTANYLVSGNKHLLRLREYRRIRILKPKEFLEVLQEQANSGHPIVHKGIKHYITDLCGVIQKIFNNL